MSRMMLKLVALSSCIMSLHAMSGAVRRDWDSGKGVPLPLMLTVDSTEDLDVPYVPTREDVVNEMLAVAGIKAGDVLYDLGCGDGRIVVTAAQRYGLRCVGVDRDPERIRESNENAARAGVTDKVRFCEQDLFETDFGEASVLALYLLPDVNLRLRPRILSVLKPGSRVVSHDFGMGEWEPDRVVEMEDRDTVYVWIVPANISGTWTWDEGDSRPVLRLTQRFQKAEGVLTRGGRELPVRELAIEGDRVSFIIEGKDGPVAYSGRIAQDRIQGKREAGGLPALDWIAARTPGTTGTIDH